MQDFKLNGLTLKLKEMKTILIIIATALLSVPAFSQNTEIIFNQYLAVKDALIKSDPEAANKCAVLLQKAIESTASFNSKKDLLKAVQKMGKTKVIEKQRIAFAEVSLIMWKVVKSSSDIKQDVYYQYCPMKKMYWLSTEAAIKNPYYGSKMLTCGNVADKKIK